MNDLANKRLLSLDLFRGLVMFLLLAEHVDLYYLLTFVAPENHVISMFVNQLFHHEWNGMHFFDLVQPYFTFVIGVAMAFSLNRRWHNGERWMESFKHIIVRCAILFVLGIILRCCVQKKLVWDLWNILTILSVNIFISFLIFRFRDSTKLAISFGLLLFMELLYRSFMVEGFDQPFVKGGNVGTIIDLALMGKVHHDGWVFVNSIPTTAHVIWGIVAGNLLLKQRKAMDKFWILAFAGMAGILIGYGMDLMNISPINKHLSTSSFIIVSGGWCLITYAVFYWLIDVKGYKQWTGFFVIIGMNPIFIYIFSRTVGTYWFHDFVAIFTKGIMIQAGVSEGIMNLITYLSILGFEWYLCYWLYKRKIYIKI